VHTPSFIIVGLLRGPIALKYWGAPHFHNFAGAKLMNFLLDLFWRSSYVLQY